jgi:hypothetical protein
LGIEALESRAVPTTTHFNVSLPLAATAGNTVNVTVTALDGSSNLATDYTGTVQLTSSDAKAVLPGTYTFVAADHGQHTFSVQLQTAGTPTVVVKDTANGSITGSVSLTLIPAALDHLALVIPSSASSGTPFTAQVVAQDAYGNTVTNYAGTVTPATTDVAGTTPPAHTFTSADQGAFGMTVMLKTLGRQTVSITDGHLQASATLPVVAGPAAVVVVTVPKQLVAGQASPVTVTVEDAGGNVSTGYRGTVQLSAAAVNGSYTLPPITYTFTATNAGVATLNITPPARGPLTITVTDTATGSVTGTLTTTAGSGSPNADFVDAVYRELLGRSADAAGLQAWTNNLNRGMARATVVSGIEGSDEYHMREVTALYEGLLGRAPDAAGLSAFTAAMRDGMTVDAATVAIMGSEEYFQVRGGATTSGFLSAVYQDLLGRGVDSGGASYFGGLLANGTSRETVAQLIQTSTEGEHVSINAAFNEFLGHGPDAASLRFFTTQKQQGMMTTESLVVSLLASSEFFNDATN